MTTYIEDTRTMHGEDDECLQDSECFQIFSAPSTKHTHNIYLSETVTNNFAYVELMHSFRSFSKGDKVTIYLANYGGQCSTGFQLFNIIKDCKARVDVVVDAPCYSMGAILALSGDSLTLQPGSFLMFHNYSTIERGKGTELHKAVTHYHNHFHKHLTKVCSPFLTKPEMNLLKNDSDVYVACDDKDLKKRIARHFK